MIRTKYTSKQKQAFKKARAAYCTIYYDRPRLHVKGFHAPELLDTFRAAFGIDNVNLYEAYNQYGASTEPALSVRR